MTSHCSPTADNSNLVHSITTSGPRPLATKPDYIPKQTTSRSNLVLPSSLSTEALTDDLEYFNFKRPVNDSLLQPNAKRAKRIYRSILRDQQFLLDLKHMWENKLKLLQVDHMLLEQMCQYTQQDVDDVPPLFSETSLAELMDQRQQEEQRLKEEQRTRKQRWQSQQQNDNQNEYPSVAHLSHNTQTVDAISSMEGRHESEMSLLETDNVKDSSYLQESLYEEAKMDHLGDCYYGDFETHHTDNEDRRHSYIDDQSNCAFSGTLHEDGALKSGETGRDGDFLYSRYDYGEDNDDDDDDEDGDDDDIVEDEETTRRALTLMLAQYGNDI